MMEKMKMKSYENTIATRPDTVLCVSCDKLSGGTFVFDFSPERS